VQETEIHTLPHKDSLSKDLVEAVNKAPRGSHARSEVSFRSPELCRTPYVLLVGAPVRWARSGLTSLFLALAAVVPAASIAAEPDRSQEGGVSAEQGQDVDTDSPDFDPGGDTDLPFDAGPPVSAPPASPDDGPLESEPVDDPDGRVAPLALPEDQVPGTPEDAPVSPTEGVQPAPPPAPGFSIEPPPTNPAPEADPPTPLQPQSLGAEPGSGPKAAGGHRRLTAVVAADDRPAPAQAPAQAPAPASDLSVATPAASGPPEVVTTANEVAPTQATGSSDAPSSTPDAVQGARVHIVRPGESLWTIAEGLLGPDASAASVAAEVARLWELNRERIPSGDPDQIAVGQELRLR
jgi:hypothetical protein